MRQTQFQWSDGVINDEIINKEVQKMMGGEEKLGVPNDYPFNKSTIIYYNDKGVPMFGQYLEHGLKEGKIRFKMLKKNVQSFRSGYWTLSCSDIDIVEQDGKLVNPDKYIKENGFYRKVIK